MEEKNQYHPHSIRDARKTSDRNKEIPFVRVRGNALSLVQEFQFFFSSLLWCPSHFRQFRKMLINLRWTNILSLVGSCRYRACLCCVVPLLLLRLLGVDVSSNKYYRWQGQFRDMCVTPMSTGRFNIGFFGVCYTMYIRLGGSQQSRVRFIILSNMFEKIRWRTFCLWKMFLIRWKIIKNISHTTRLFREHQSYKSYEQRWFLFLYLVILPALVRKYLHLIAVFLHLSVAAGSGTDSGAELVVEKQTRLSSNQDGEDGRQKQKHTQYSTHFSEHVPGGVNIVALIRFRIWFLRGVKGGQALFLCFYVVFIQRAELVYSRREPWGDPRAASAVSVNVVFVVIGRRAVAGSIVLPRIVESWVDSILACHRQKSEYYFFPSGNDSLQGYVALSMAIMWLP